MSLYSGAHKVLAGLLRKFFCCEVIGGENEPSEGGLIVCPNHLSNLDVIIVSACLKRQVHYMAKAELFKVPLLKQLVTALGAFPIDRRGSDVGAIKRCISMVKEGNVIGFYPQGTRHPGVDPAETEIKSGIGMVAKRAQVPILPVCIQTKGYKIKLFRKIYITVGRPIMPEEFGDAQASMEEYTRISRMVFDRVLELRREDIEI